MGLFHHHSPFRIFGVSAFATVAVLLAALIGLGAEAAFVTLILIAVELAFSFDNAIINAKILGRLSQFWQNIFLTVGILIAVIGMRVIFPILIVSLTAHLPWSAVLDLALRHPEEYGHKLEAAHPTISAFGGAFLLMLALHFFLDDAREVLWLKRLERSLQSIATVWMPALLSTLVVGAVALIPANHHERETLTAGALGIVTFLAIHGVSSLLSKTHQRSLNNVAKQTGLAAAWTFLYLEVLDASFSFDGVIGAFAVTNQVVLIAAGLGIGALWVRSLTVFMVRRGTLQNYIYLEHGAHYTVAVLAAVMLVSIFLNIPEAIAGLVGIGLITASVLASREALGAGKQKHG